MGRYWENSIKDYFKNDQLKHIEKSIIDSLSIQQEVFVMNENEHKRKYKVGDLVNIKDEKEVFEIIEWIYECVHDTRDGFDESSYYNLRAKSGRCIDLVDEDDSRMSLVVPKATKTEKKIDPMSKEGIDHLLDLYNKYRNVQLFLESIGVKDNEYKDKAKEVMSYIKRTSKAQLKLAKPTQ